MAKKKTAKKRTVQNNVITSIAVIKDCKIKPECGVLNFDGFNFTAAQYKQIALLIADQEAVEVSFAPVQKALPFGSEEDDPAEYGDGEE